MKTKGSWRNNYQRNKFLFQIRFSSNRFFSFGFSDQKISKHRLYLMGTSQTLPYVLSHFHGKVSAIGRKINVHLAGIDSRTNLTTFLIFSHYLSDPLQSRFVDRKPSMNYKSLHCVRQQRRRLSPSFGSFLVWNHGDLYSRRWWQKLRHL